MDTDWIGTHRKRYANRKFDEYFFRKPCDQTVFKDILRIHSLRNPTSFSYIPRPKPIPHDLVEHTSQLQGYYTIQIRRPGRTNKLFVQAPGSQFFQMWPPSGGRFPRSKHGETTAGCNWLGREQFAKLRQDMELAAESAYTVGPIQVASVTSQNHSKHDIQSTRNSWKSWPAKLGLQVKPIFLRTSNSVCFKVQLWSSRVQ